ncbi:unnamed protein product [Lactuca saligna]|uniref:Uncharacterized protein n=1 Tax=Lactuca saligna TaxID=75948 RepID=A0AA35ZCB4_LACSI|nr:unnamed protein product [Lactuca saligna]
MVIEDTPPNSPGDNPPPSPPSSSNHPPPPPPPSHPPLHTPSPPLGSPTQSNAIKNRENIQEILDQQMQMVAIASPPSQPKMSGSGRVEVYYQKEIVVVVKVSKIPDANATIDDQPIPYVGDQSEIDDYGGFLDPGLMPKVIVPAVPLSVVFPDSYFDGDIPQGTNSNIECDDDHLNP